MTAIISKKYRVFAAKKFKEAFTTSASQNMYFFIGKALPWRDETLPATSRDVVKQDSLRWQDMIALKKITETSVSFVAERNDWTSGTRYVAYDDLDINLYTHPTAAELSDASSGGYTAGDFYVMTDESNVYKCIYAPKDTNSTSKPTGTSTSIVETADGYRWKYMGTITASDAQKFLTPDWMPVKKLDSDDGSQQWDVQAAATDGAIEEIFVLSRLTFSAAITDLLYPGDIIVGGTSGAYGRVVEQSSDKTYVDIVALRGTFQNSESITKNAVSLGNSASSNAIVTGGSGYTAILDGVTAVSGTSTTIVLPGAASASDDHYNGSSVYIRSGTGAGQVREISDYDGSSKTATVSTAWSTNPDATSVVDVLPTVTISGDGSGATADFDLDENDISGGVISRIRIATAGSGYRNATITIAAGQGTGAIAKPVISPDGGHGSDMVEELGGSNIMADVELQNDDADFPPSNEYRRIGIIADVLVPGDTIASAATLSAMKSITVSSVTGSFTNDETITSNGSGTPTAKIVYVVDNEDTTYTIYYVQDEDTGYLSFGAAETLTGGSSSATATIDSTAAAEVKKHSGKVLYVENRRAVVRASNQIESFKPVLEF